MCYTRLFFVDVVCPHYRTFLRISAGGRYLLLADVLLVPHHGAKTSSTPAFIAAAAPLHTVFTVGYRNRFGHPRPEIFARYTAHGTQIWRSDRDGTISVELTASGARLTNWREPVASLLAENPRRQLGHLPPSADLRQHAPGRAK
ncbi:ComEC/Rec2 family competence protein [Aquaspirillum serpens]|uniref:ComEC/Rec2 family competence protein n=1 Tax=Aquaspirillum serpens TaxID=190 RepID=UPI0003B44AC7|nr:hypothetical protein [Aquaspirillum serpens]